VSGAPKAGTRRNRHRAHDYDKVMVLGGSSLRRHPITTWTDPFERTGLRQSSNRLVLDTQLGHVSRPETVLVPCKLQKASFRRMPFAGCCLHSNRSVLILPHLDNPYRTGCDKNEVTPSEDAPCSPASFCESVDSLSHSGYGPLVDSRTVAPSRLDWEDTFAAVLPGRRSGRRIMPCRAHSSR